MAANNEKILIVSATSKNNLVLAKRLSEFLDGDTDVEIVNLEDYELPLFKPGIECDPETIAELIERFQGASGFIFCAPEYNGGVPPILSNALTWITNFTENWRDAFSGKVALIATHSAGQAFRFLSTFRNQLEYLGTIVMPRTITIVGNQSLNDESVKRVISGFTRILNNKKELD